MAVIEIRRTVNMDGALVPESMAGTLFGGEEQAHRFIITATQGGEQLPLAGAVSARFVRQADNVEVPLTGSASNGAAQVTLAENCYYQPGRFSLTIYVTADGSTTAIYSCAGNVMNTSGGSVVDPGEITLDVQDLIADIDSAVASIPSSYSSLLSTIAPTFSSSTAYAAGQYVWYNGTLYRFTADHAAGTWTGTDAASVVIGGEIASTCGAMEGLPFDVVRMAGGIRARTHNGVTFTPVDGGSACVVNGSAATATAFDNIFASQTALPMGVKPGQDIRVFVQTTNTTSLKCAMFFYDANGQEIGNQYIHSTRVVTLPEELAGVYIRVQADRGSTMSNDKISVAIYPAVYGGNTFREFSTRIDALDQDTLRNGYIFAGDDANDLPDNNWSYLEGRSAANCPTSTGGFWVLTMPAGVGSTTKMQFAVGWSTGLSYYRRSNSGTWTDWVQNVPPQSVTNGFIYDGTDADDINANIWYYCDRSTVDNCPGTGVNAYWILTLRAAGSASASKTRIQMAWEWGTGKQYWRRSNYSGTWTAWGRGNPLAIGSRYVAFGDSVTKGAVWTDTEIYTAPLADQIPSRIAGAIGMAEDYVNEAVGSTGYLAKVNNQSMTDKIIAYDFTGVEVMTMMAGVNDKSQYQLGTPASVAGDGTICGAIKTILNHMAANWPRVQIIVIQPTPAGHLADPWNGKLGGGWSLNDFNEQVGALCANEHVAYVNLVESVYCKQWDSFSGGSGTGTSANYSHFRDPLDYAKFGDFIAGKVSAFFHGNN